MPDSKTRTRPRTFLLILAAGLLLAPLARGAAKDGDPAGQAESLDARLVREIKEGRKRIRSLEDSLRNLGNQYSDLEPRSSHPAVTAELQTLREQLYLERGLQDVWYTMRERVRQGHHDINALELDGASKEGLRNEYDRLIQMYVDSRMAEILARRELATAYTDEARTEAEELLTLREAQAGKVRMELRRFLLDNSLEQMESQIY